jgi:hypothetical protein
VAGTCECGNEPSRFIKCGELIDYKDVFSFSGRTVLHGVSYTGDQKVCT